MDVDNLTQEYDKLLAKKTNLLVETKIGKTKIRKIKKEISAHIEARDTIAKVIRLTQFRIKKYIEKTVTLAIRSVFDRPYTFHLKFKEQRNRVECIATVRERGNIRDPKSDMGGGLMDIIAIGFRVALLLIENPRSRMVLLLDQPFSHCGGLIKKAAIMVKELSRELSVQFIIITHERRLSKIADRAWFVDHDGEKSIVNRIIKRRWKDGEEADKKGKG